MTEYRDIVIIGGGSAGMAAAVGAWESGCRSVLILEREPELGGILNQCIHNGFGLHMFKEELTGPEYAQRFIEKVIEYGIEYRCSTTVLSVGKDRTVVAVSPETGLTEIKAGAVILAMGCRERPRGSLMTPGTRAAGIYTAGTAQRLLNREGYLPGKKVLILGSGDIGLIMARRFTLQGAEVVAVAEIMPYSGGLARNIAQCLDDFGIPLLLSHTVVDIEGEDRVSAVTIAKVDDKLNPIPGTEIRYEVDTLLLSVGLIPENELANGAGVEIATSTKGADVSEDYETSVPGIFECGNSLHVHDLVDNVSMESLSAGRSAAAYVRGELGGEADCKVVMGNQVNAAVPQRIHSGRSEGTVRITFRPRKTLKGAYICADADGRNILRRRSMILAPGEMVTLDIKNELIPAGTVELTLRLEENE